ncbi:hypothetical protein FN846DRAFT_772171 [Sphaerosporella brunnea]|uniref:Nudix hydrolase domain-containing protein n=1 Tax=Sphaerosporella brunnea TaxID=1250544 RepID=A0A5J5F999_9PEZI|nr:hypothetical protein FN846DRAFT_772171 [Sphaerosporella brunnea]
MPIFNPLQFALRRHLSMTPNPAPAPIRPSASLLLLSPTNRLLLLKRNTHLSFASAHVFPGGVVQPSDGGSARLCALRETFEETGILLTSSAPPASAGPLAEIQRRVHSGELDFGAWVDAWGGQLLPDSELTPFTTWITPAGAGGKKRYSSQLFLARLPPWVDESAVVPGDGGREVVGAPRWMLPAEALRLATEGAVTLFPPQFYLLWQVERHLRIGGEQALVDWARAMGEKVFEPRKEGVTEEGWWVMGLGPRGDAEVVVVMEVLGKGLEPRAVEVMERTAMKERLAKL